ncbi:MAG: hypothetical protein QNJ32_21550 [Xenococcaceae cyanobacterium MO_167.B27]|nr:hypothetical protein [Xenococcaceae cyanobacterium MO_167.B27]
MEHRNSWRRKQEKQSQLWIYLLPVVGTIPALWTLYRRTGNAEQQNTSRLSLVLLLLWLTGYISLFLGAANGSEVLAFRLLYANTILTSGYFVICLGLMFRLRTGKSPYLPLISQVVNKIGRKSK